MGQIKNIKLHIVTDIKNIVLTHNHPTTTMSAMRKVLPTMSRVLTPFADRVLVQRLVPETTTKSGILLPEKSVGKVNEGTVVAVGEGARNQDGAVIPMNVEVGDNVLLPEFGGTKLELDQEEFMLFRESDLLGKFE